MRARATVVFLVAGALATPAAAAPCHIDYVSMPEGVREVVEAWVDQEAHCVGSISLRVIPTADGYFVFGERPDGHVHERLVPELTAVGVLVASWLSDAWDVAPSAPRAIAPRVVAAVPAASSDEHAVLSPVLWASVSRTRDQDGEVGGRGEIDLIRPGGWAFGLNAGSLGKRTEDVWFDDQEVVSVRDYAVGLHAAYAISMLGFELRGQLTYGMVYSTADAWDISPGVLLEASARLSREITKTFAISLGVSTTTFSQQWHGEDPATADSPEMSFSRRGDGSSLFAGVRWAL